MLVLYSYLDVHARGSRNLVMVKKHKICKTTLFSVPPDPPRFKQIKLIYMLDYID